MRVNEARQSPRCGAAKQVCLAGRQCCRTTANRFARNRSGTVVSVARVTHPQRVTSRVAASPSRCTARTSAAMPKRGRSEIGQPPVTVVCEGRCRTPRGFDRRTGWTRFRPNPSAAIESFEQPVSLQPGAPLPTGFPRVMSLRDGGPPVRVRSVFIPVLLFPCLPARDPSGQPSRKVCAHGPAHSPEISVGIHG